MAIVKVALVSDYLAFIIAIALRKYILTVFVSLFLQYIVLRMFETISGLQQRCFLT